ncbi:TPA: hypothetical protein N0F65_011643 [Lagenidium giganteum]|uniref:Acid phosphatase n=1 Tax=Lagenidium giganteum TaxID=4803 RepID=A0AAV2ZDB1_9STRA|nr:TPA: hypothetical protein N0F65_011643 [Lagenidium giganteum]
MSMRRQWTVRQLQVLHRHGDRSPLHNVFQGVSQQEHDERALWQTRMPRQRDLAHLTQQYAVRHTAATTGASGSAGTIIPPQAEPFGTLTTTGLEQMKQRGSRLRELCDREGFAVGALSVPRVQVFSNSYLRTQRSVQSLLSGLFHDRPEMTPLIEVLPPATDMINTYAAFPEIADLKNALELVDDTFGERERQMAPRKAELMRLLPLYANGSVPFTWMTTADYFTCRDAHDVPLIPHTSEHLDSTLTHLSFRFQQFYSQQTILGLVAGRLMRNVINEVMPKQRFIDMHRAVQGHDDRKDLVIYSGHDVSVLAALHAIGAQCVHETKWWPTYASALTFELLEDERGNHRVRARLDGQPLVQTSGDGAAECAFADFEDNVLAKLGPSSAR